MQTLDTFRALIQEKCRWKPSKPEIGQYVAEVALELDLVPDSLAEILQHMEQKANAAGK